MVSCGRDPLSLIANPLPTYRYYMYRSRYSLSSGANTVSSRANVVSARRDPMSGCSKYLLYLPGYVFAGLRTDYIYPRMLYHERPDLWVPDTKLSFCARMSDDRCSGPNCRIKAIVSKSALTFGVK